MDEICIIVGDGCVDYMFVVVMYLVYFFGGFELVVDEVLFEWVECLCVCDKV